MFENSYFDACINSRDDSEPVETKFNAILV